MKKEEKQLLIKDLCARLPYKVKGMAETTDGNGKEIKDEGVLNSVFINEYGKAYICIEGMEYELDGFKPYLRPMSSMTEEENEYRKELIKDIKHGANIDKLEDFYHSRNLDYHGLIEKGLALEAPEDMYEI